MFKKDRQTIELKPSSKRKSNSSRIKRCESNLRKVCCRGPGYKDMIKGKCFDFECGKIWNRVFDRIKGVVLIKIDIPDRDPSNLETEKNCKPCHNLISFIYNITHELRKIKEFLYV